MQAGGGAARIFRQRSEDMDEALLAVRRVFDTFDRDADGTIDCSELGLLLEMLGQPERSKAELRHTALSLDADGSGSIEFQEFAELLKQWQEDELHDVFAFFDKDGSGEIDIQEFRQALTSLGQDITAEHLDELVVQADADGSGSIALDEFCVFVRPYMSMTRRCEYAAHDDATNEGVRLVLTSVGCEVTRSAGGSGSPHGRELLPFPRFVKVEVEEGAVVALTK